MYGVLTTFAALWRRSLHPLFGCVLLQAATHPNLFNLILRMTSAVLSFVRRSALAGAAITVLMLAFVSTPPSADAQGLWLSPYKAAQVGVEVVRPDMKDIDGLSAGYFFTGMVPLTAGTQFVTEMPVSHINASEFGSTTQVGNPYVGLAFTPRLTPVMIEVGGRLPLAEDEPVSVFGQHAEVGRYGAFLPEGGQLTGSLNTRFTLMDRPPHEVITVRVRAGGSYAHSTVRAFEPSLPRVDQDLFSHYSAQFWYEGRRVDLGLGLFGYANLTSPGSYGDNSRHDLALTSHVNVYSVFSVGTFVGWRISGAFRNVDSWPRAQDATRDVTSWRFGVTLSAVLF